MKMEKIINQDPETVLVEKILAGEQALFEVIIRRLNPSLYKVARSFGYNHADAQDLMQEAYLQVYLQLKAFEGRSSLKTWATKILINKCIYKKSYGYSKHEAPATDHIDENSIPMQSSNPNTTTERTIINREFSKLLEYNLNELPDTYKTVFVLREVEGFNVAETAMLLDITPVNVKVRLNRAKAMLQQKMEKFYSSNDIYEFNLVYCDAMVTAVFKKIETHRYV
jgi:RNA polymerase sigma factor (sigma-70 family)